MAARPELHGLAAPFRVAWVGAWASVVAAVGVFVWGPLLWPLLISIVVLWSVGIVVYVQVQWWLRKSRKSQGLAVSAATVGRGIADLLVGILTCTSLSVLSSGVVTAAKEPGLSQVRCKELERLAITLRRCSYATIVVSVCYALLLLGTYLLVLIDPAHQRDELDFGYLLVVIFAIFGGLVLVLGINSGITFICLKDARRLLAKQSEPAA